MPARVECASRSNWLGDTPGWGIGQTGFPVRQVATCGEDGGTASTLDRGTRGEQPLQRPAWQRTGSAPVMPVLPSGNSLRVLPISQTDNAIPGPIHHKWRRTTSGEPPARPPGPGCGRVSFACGGRPLRVPSAGIIQAGVVQLLVRNELAQYEEQDFRSGLVVIVNRYPVTDSRPNGVLHGERVKLDLFLAEADAQRCGQLDYVAGRGRVAEAPPDGDFEG
jgi:hypothetical protein